MTDCKDYNGEICGYCAESEGSETLGCYEPREAKRGSVGVVEKENGSIEKRDNKSEVEREIIPCDARCEKCGSEAVNKQHRGKNAEWRILGDIEYKNKYRYYFRFTAFYKKRCREG